MTEGELARILPEELYATFPDLQERLLAAAKDYATRGLKSFPVRHKQPLTPNGFKDATADLQRIERWYRELANVTGIGIPTGRTTGLLALDVDLESDGLKSIDRLTREHEKFPLTWTQHTGGGGWQLLFDYPPDYPEIRISAGKLGPGLDIRAEGGYIVVPPSLHASGGVYVWPHGRCPGSIAKVPPPGWFLDLLLQGENRRRTKAVRIEEEILEGRRDAHLASVAGKWRDTGMELSELEAGLLAVNQARCKPPLPDDQVLKIARSIVRYEPKHADLEPEEKPRPEYSGPAKGLVEVVDTFQRWLFLPDAAPLYVTLATLLANRFHGRPIWLLLVAPPSSGKNELVVACSGLAEVFPVGTMTEAALLSGTAKQQVAHGARGGLLRSIGAYGVLAIKDFGAILEMRPDQKAALLQALREVYDGHYVRTLGVDGGRVLSWEGKVGMIGGVTEAIDEYTAVMTALGERMMFLRFFVEDEQAQGLMALQHASEYEQMQTELREAVCALLASYPSPVADELSKEDFERVLDLARLTTHARAPVLRERMGRREIVAVLKPEAPSRFALQLQALVQALRLLELGEDVVWDLAGRVALSSVPAVRMRILEALHDEDEWVETEMVRRAVGMPRSSTIYHLDNLVAQRVIRRIKPEKTVQWRLASDIRARLDVIRLRQMSRGAFDTSFDGDEPLSIENL